jgi:RimJ/RimL family protein N-acetyltransferase
VSLDGWPDVLALEGRRVRLESLRVEHAEELASLLNDPKLHSFIGGRPANLPELRERYRRQVAGRSPDGAQRWFNWVVRRCCDGQAVGTVQATVAETGDGLSAEVAWVVATAYQGRGYAREAAEAMVAWLREQGAGIVAHIHPDHQASAAVARAVGLAPTSTLEDGELRWEG